MYLDICYDIFHDLSIDSFLYLFDKYFLINTVYCFLMGWYMMGIYFKHTISKKNKKIIIKKLYLLHFVKVYDVPLETCWIMTMNY